jgi:hypothetical protein
LPGVGRKGETVLWLLGAATPPPIDEDQVTPGVWGFIAIAAVMIASILLILDMVRRIRRVRYRAEVQERLAAEAEAAANGEPLP